MAIIDGFDEESILSVNNLGIVARAFDTLGLGKVIDRAIPKTRHHNLSHNPIIKAMTINSLGFVERRLYLFPDFYEDIAGERLLGKRVHQDQLNDDVLGKTLGICNIGLPFRDMFDEIRICYHDFDVIFQYWGQPQRDVPSL